jgi:hypothetical protein
MFNVISMSFLLNSLELSVQLPLQLQKDRHLPSQYAHLCSFLTKKNNYIPTYYSLADYMNTSQVSSFAVETKVINIT